MGWNDHVSTWGDGETYIKTCYYCKKKYRSVEVPQIAGFREKDDDVCPYCNKSNRTSMEVEFSNSYLEEGDA